MTNREFYSMIANGYARKDIKDGAETIIKATPDEMRVFALAEIAKLDKRNAKRRETPTAAQTENAAIMEKIALVLSNGGKIAADIGVAVGISTNKAAALLKIMTEIGSVVTSEIKIKGKGRKTLYTLTAPDETDG